MSGIGHRARNSNFASLPEYRLGRREKKAEEAEEFLTSV